MGASFSDRRTECLKQDTCTLKPIFHCDSKPFALYFALPNAKYTNMLVSFPLGDANFSRYPTQNSNASQWNIGCVGSQNTNFSRWP